VNLLSRDYVSVIYRSRT